MPIRRFLMLLLVAAPSLAHAEWSHDPLAPTEFLAGGDDSVVRGGSTVSDGVGGFYLVSAETTFDPEGFSHTGIRVLRVDQNGNPVWPAGGIPVTSFPIDIYQVQGASDGAGGLIVAWSDRRRGPGRDVYAQRYDPLGNALWTPNGVLVSTGLDPVWAVGTQGTLLRSDDGGATWQPLGSPTVRTLRTVASNLEFPTAIAGDTYIGNSAGLEAPWYNHQMGVYTFYDIDFTDGAGMAVGTTGVLRVWDEDTWGVPSTPFSSNTMFGVAISPDLAVAVGGVGATFTSSDGGSTWTPGSGGAGQVLYDVDFVIDQTFVAVGGNGTIQRSVDGGATWSVVSAPTAYNINAVDILPSGRGIAVGPNGLALTTLDGGQTWTARPTGTNVWLNDVTMPRDNDAVAVGNGGAVLRTTDGGTTWTESVSGTTESLLGVASSGSLNQDYVFLASDGAGGAVLLYTEVRALYDRDLLAQRIDATGNVVWAAPAEVVVYPSVPWDFAIIEGSPGGAIVRWGEDRGSDGGQDVFAQIVYADGSVLQEDGLAVAASPELERDPAVTSDGAGGAYFAWTDYRDPVTYSEVYWAHLSADGVVLTDPGGERLTPDGVRASHPELARGPNGSFAAAWSDTRDGGIVNPNVYMQRFNAFGSPVWPVDVPVVATPYVDYGTRLVPDGHGGFLVAARVHSPVLTWHVTIIDAWGNFQWPDGHAVLHNNGASVTALPDGNHGFLGLWTAADVSGFRIFGQNVDRHGYFGVVHPSLSSVVDVPYDQGGVLLASWDASNYDAFPHQLITHYSVWRRTGAAKRRVIAADREAARVRAEAEGISSTLIASQETSGWVYAGQTVAAQLPQYGHVVESFGDAVGTEAPITEVQVIAHTFGPFVNWMSSVLGGSSVDNLAPDPPQQLLAVAHGADVDLIWLDGLQNVEDTGSYRIYRGSTSGFPVGPSSLIASAVDPTHRDPLPGGGTHYYRVTAVDVHGNESAPSAVATAMVVTAAGPIEGVGTMVLSPPAPNPFNPSTSLSFVLPGPGRVRVAVYDLRGRLVRSLLSADLDAGSHTVIWDGRSDSERTVASGVYAVRLQMAGITLTRRAVLAK